MFGLFKRYRKYHVVFICAKKGSLTPIFADQLVVTPRKIDAYYLQELRDNAKEEHGYEKVAILNIVKL